MTDAEMVDADMKLAARLRSHRATKTDMETAADRLEKLNEEVERWFNSYRIAADQAMMNGQAAQMFANDAREPIRHVPIDPRYSPTRNDS